MRLSKRPATSIAVLVTAAVALPATASAAPDVGVPTPIFPPPGGCRIVAPPQPGAVKFTVSPGKVKEGTQPQLTYVISNAGKTCLGVSAAPYGLQISGFAGWSDIAWDVGILPQYIRYLQPGQSIKGRTAPLPADLGAGGFYRVIPKFTPDAKQPVTSAPLDVV